MAELDTELEFFRHNEEGFKAEHLGQWVLIRDSHLEGYFDTFEDAAEKAVAQFGRGPYLIRQIGAPPMTLPASAMYVFGHAGD